MGLSVVSPTNYAVERRRHRQESLNPNPEMNQSLKKFSHSYNNKHSPVVTYYDMLRRLHIQKGDIWHSGVDAFIHLWAEVPGFNWLARLVSLPPVRMIAVPVYDHVLAPWLYRRHLRRVACEVS